MAGTMPDHKPPSTPRNATSYIVVAGRLLYSAIFITAGFQQIYRAQETVAAAAKQGVPLAHIAVPMAAVIAIFGGVSILLGYYAAGWGLAAGPLFGPRYSDGAQLLGREESHPCPDRTDHVHEKHIDAGRRAAHRLFRQRPLEPRCPQEEDVRRGRYDRTGSPTPRRPPRSSAPAAASAPAKRWNSGVAFDAF